jgi:hypothetical protein
LSSTFILGLEDTIDGSSYASTEDVYNRTGQNAGNLAFHYAMVKILGGPQEVLPWHAPPERINQMGKTGILPCANQLSPRSDYGRLGERYKTLTIPLVAVGLGAQGDSQYRAIPVVPEGSQNWVRAIAQRSTKGMPNIGVRGQFTLKVLESYGLGDCAVITGCPTLFLNPDPNLGQKIEERARRPFAHIAVAAGHQRWKNLSKIEASLTQMMAETGGSYIVQSPIQLIAIARGEIDSLSHDDLIECRDYARPDLDLVEFKTWARKYFRVFFNVSEWMEFLRSHDFVVGTRIHGVILGLQAGIPSLCIAHDSRTRELCETMHVPFIMARDVMDGMTHDKLRASFSFDGASFDENRRTLGRRLDELLRANDIAESSLLKTIVQS